MWISVAADELTGMASALVREVERRGHRTLRHGALGDGERSDWAWASEAAARDVAEGRAQQAIVCCWTGTGASIAANKVPGVRAALCTDAVTAAGARVWNHANVLCLSNRLISGDVAREIVGAWLDTDPGDKGASGVDRLRAVEARHRRP
jgi:ribose 5-phosphate isomerase B